MQEVCFERGCGDQGGGVPGSSGTARRWVREQLPGRGDVGGQLVGWDGFSALLLPLDVVATEQSNHLLPAFQVLVVGLQRPYDVLGWRHLDAQALWNLKSVVPVSIETAGPGARLCKLPVNGRAGISLGFRWFVIAGPCEVATCICNESRLRNSWGWRLGAVLNSPGKHPFALDRRLDAGSGGPAARREVEVGLFRRVADRASEHRWVTDAGRAPRGVAGGALVMSPGVRAGRR